MKKLSILIAVVLALSFSLVPAVTVSAADPATINVPADYETIQEAIDAAGPGDTINVAAGTYAEQVVIDKNLTLLGAQAGVDPTVEGARTEESEESVIDANTKEGNAVEIGANDVVVDGFTVKNVHDEPTDADPTAKYAIKMLPQSEDHSVYSSDITIQYNILTENSRGIYILDNESSLVRKNLIEKCASSTTGTYGWYHGGSAIVISYVTLAAVVTENLLTKNVAKTSYYGPILVSAASGAFVPGGETTRPTITDNRIVGNYTQGMSYGILLLGTGAIVRGNTITGNEGGGIWASDFYALPPENPILIEGNTIAENGLQGVLLCNELVVGVEGNTIVDNVGTGISILGQPADVAIHENSIYGNGLGVSSGVPTNAKNNWWGQASGPSEEAIVGDVDVVPWLLAESGDPFDTALLLPAGWSIVSPDAELASHKIVASGIIMVLAYCHSEDAEGELVGAFTSDFSLDPITPVFVKTETGGWIGFRYAGASQGIFTTNLEAGWNLIGIPQTSATPGAILSPIRLGVNNEVALATLASQGNYNPSEVSFYESMLNLEALLPALYPFDGYWAYMNVAKEFGVVVVGK